MELKYSNTLLTNSFNLVEKVREKNGLARFSCSIWDCKGKLMAQYNLDEPLKGQEPVPDLITLTPHHLNNHLIQVCLILLCPQHLDETFVLGESMLRFQSVERCSVLPKLGHFDIPVF